MMSTFRPRGHIQVKLDANGRTRAFWAFWRDQNDQKRGRRLGPAHVRDSGRRTPRGAIVWRAGYGEKPSPDYLTPKEAEDRLEDILAALRAGIEDEQSTGHSARPRRDGSPSARTSGASSAPPSRATRISSSAFTAITAPTRPSATFSTVG